MSMGSRIRQAREDKGYTQEYIAEVLGISRQAVHKWEKDRTNPDTHNLISLAELLGVSVDFLATGDGPPSHASSVNQSRLALRFQLCGLGCLMLAVICWCLGLFSGVFTDMVQVPIRSGLRMGIPLLLYGDSPAAIVLLVVQIISLLLSILLLILGYQVNKD